MHQLQWTANVAHVRAAVETIDEVVAQEEMIAAHAVVDLESAFVQSTTRKSSAFVA
jgi:hypothetical protein